MILQPSALPPATWERLLAAPYASPADEARAWEPIADGIQTTVSMWSRKRDQKGLSEALKDIGPSPWSGSKLGVFTFATLVRGPQPGALVQIVASEHGVSRGASLLFYRQRGRLRYQDVTALMPFKDSPLAEASAYEAGPWLGIAGSRWSMLQESPENREAGMVLRFSAGSWHKVAEREAPFPVSAQVQPNRQGAPSILARVKLPDATFTEPSVEVVQRWEVRAGRLVMTAETPVRDEYWALHGLLQALRHRDRRKVERFVVDRRVLASLRTQELTGGPVRVLEFGSRSMNDSGLQIDGPKPDGGAYVYQFRFSDARGRTLIANIRRTETGPTKVEGPVR